MRRKSLQERFNAKVSIDAESGCWIWKGAHDVTGYGRISLDGKTGRASRVSYTLFRGPIPEGMVLDHFRYPDGGCIGTRCVNPYHLLLTTRSENAGRTSWSRRTHCPQGHEYTPDNIYVQTTARGTKGRRCRTCAKQCIAKWQKRNPDKVKEYRKKGKKKSRARKPHARKPTSAGPTSVLEHALNQAAA